MESAVSTDEYCTHTQFTVNFRTPKKNYDHHPDAKLM